MKKIFTENWIQNAFWAGKKLKSIVFWRFCGNFSTFSESFFDFPFHFSFFTFGELDKKDPRFIFAKIFLKKIF